MVSKVLYYLSKAFTLLFSFEPHMDCVRRWNIIIFTLHVKRILEF